MSLEVGNESGKTMLVICFIVSVIFPSVFAQEEPVSINRPRTRTQQPWVPQRTDYVRCFCNLPPCVATAYMCKSSAGGCFSDLLDSSRMAAAYRGRHGCIEYLSESRRTRCPVSDKDGQLRVQDKEHPRSLLVCCTNDMCNHVDNPSTRILLNNTSGDESNVRLQQQNQETYLYSNSEVWFRAATIAVPICGAVILFALIAVAVKILKSEHQNSPHHKLGPAMYVVPSEQKHDKWSDHPYKPCTIKKPYYTQAHLSAFALRHEEDVQNRQFQMPLLVSSEMRDFNNANSSSNTINQSKNDANAKLNFMQCDSNSSRSIILEIGKSSPDYSVAANMNLTSEVKFSKSDKAFTS